MSNISSFIDLRETIFDSVQSLTFKESNLIDQSDVMRANICHHLIEQQTQKLEQMNKNLLKLIDSKKKEMMDMNKRI